MSINYDQFTKEELILEIEKLNKKISDHKFDAIQIEEHQILKNELKLFSRGPVVMFTWGNSEGWPISYVSENVIDLLGYSAEEFLNNEIIYSNIINEYDILRVKKELAKAIENNQEFVLQAPYRVKKKNGETIWLYDSTILIKDNKGETISLFGYVYDISSIKVNEQKLETALRDFEWKSWELETAKSELEQQIEENKAYEKRLVESEEKYRALFNNMIDGFAFHRVVLNENQDPIDFTFEEANDAFEIHSSISRDECIGKTARDISKHYDEALIAKLCSVGITGEPLSLEYFDENTKKHIKVNAFSPKSGYFASIIEDISDRKNAQEKINMFSERLYLATQSAKIGIWEWELETNEVDWNDIMFEIYGINPEDFQGTIKDWEKMIYSEDIEGLTNEAKRAITNKNEISQIFRISRPDGSIRFIKAFADIVLDDKQNPVRLVGVNLDITKDKYSENELKELIQELKQSKEIIELNLSQKNELIEKLANSETMLKAINAEKDKFFSIIAHDLRSPLYGFLGLTQIMSENLYDLTIKDLQEYSSTLQQSASHLFKLLENLLEWTKLQRGLIKYSPIIINLPQIIKQNIDINKQRIDAKELTIESFSPENLLAFADKSMLDGVLRNLISNAIKFTPKGGKIVIDVKANAHNEVEVCVKDNGIGMSSNVIDKLFKLDEKVSTPGTEGEPSTGLGLIICKEFIESNKGKLRVESVENEGSTFAFTLPAYK